MPITRDPRKRGESLLCRTAEPLEYSTCTGATPHILESNVHSFERPDKFEYRVCANSPEASHAEGMMEAAPVRCVICVGAVYEIARPKLALGNAAVVGAKVLPARGRYDIRRRADIPDTT